MKLIICCDDYNLAPGIDRGILEAVDAGLVTAVSAFAGEEAAFEALRKRSALDVGLHFDLTSGLHGPARSPWSLALGAITGAPGSDEISCCLEAQHRQLRAALGRPLSHLDSHEHVHALPVVRRALADLAAREGVPYVRVPFEALPGFSPKAWILRAAFGRPHPQVAFIGLRLMGRGFSADRLARTLSTLREQGHQRALWMVHVGDRDDHVLHGRRDYPHRRRELDQLLAAGPLIRSEVELVGLSDLPAAPHGQR